MRWKCIVQNVSGKGTSTAKQFIKGYYFFKFGHVVKLEKHNRRKDGLCHLIKLDNNHPIHQVKFVKHQHGKKKSDVDGLRQSKDVRAPYHRNVDGTELYNLRCKLENLASKGQEIGLLHILPRKSMQEVLEDVSHDHGYCRCSSDTKHIISPPKVHPISLQGLKGRCFRKKRKLVLEDDQIKVIERETKDQSLKVQSNLKQDEARKFRITASKCKRVASMEESTYPVKALQEMLHYNQPF